MPRRRRSFFFDNINKRLLVNTFKNARTSKTEMDAGTVTADDILKKSQIDSDVDASLANLVNAAPATLDTLDELAAALGDDANFATTTATSLGNRLRVDTNAQGLNTTQKTNAVTNLGLATVATSGAYSDLTGTPTIPTNNNQLTNGAGYTTTTAQEISRTGLSSSDDLGSGSSTPLSSGWYGWGNSQPSNSPDDYALLWQLNDGGQPQQWVMAYGGSANSMDLYARRKTSGTWDTTWTKFWNSTDFSSTNVSNWNTAYGWGNHASEGYLTGITSSQVTTALGYTPAEGTMLASKNTGTPDTAGDNYGLNAHYMTSAATNKPTGTDHSLLTLSYNNAWQTQLAGDWRTNKWYVRVQTNGTWGGWDQILTTADEGSGNGIDADTVDGIHGSSLLRSDANDTATGELTFSGSFTAQSKFLNGATNFDNLKVSGFYSLYNVNASGHTNAPFQYGAMIQAGNTAVSGGMGMQIAHERTGAGTYIRGMNDTNDTWYPWQEIWTSGTDGPGSGLDADTVDGIHGSSLLRSDANDTMSGTLTMTGALVGRVCTNATFTSANDAGSMSIRGNTTKPAVVSFHRAYAYAVQFGLDTDNHLKMGGWSAGSIKHTWKNNGEYNAVGNVVAYSSDARLKTNIKNIPNSLEKVMSLNGVTFDWKEEVKTLGFEPSRMHGEAGVLAQEVESVLPQATAPAPFDRENIDGEDVSKSGENYLTVQYEKIVPLLIEAIKEQQEQIEELKARLL